MTMELFMGLWATLGWGLASVGWIILSSREREISRLKSALADVYKDSF